MKAILNRAQSFVRPDTLAVLLFVHLILFQIFLVTRLRILYLILGILFGALVLMLAGLALRAVLKQKALLLLILAVFAARLPYYFHPDGLVTTSDNAVEALQSLEIKDDRQAPFFLHETLRHQGTVKYLWVSYLWEVFRPDYLLIVLLQTVLFILLLVLLHEIFKPLVSRAALWLLLGLNFAFIEIVWDYSLYIRGAPYLEMLVFFLLGVCLFDPSFKQPGRLFLGAFFVFFSIYIHPLSLFFVLSFWAAMVWPSLRARALMKLGLSAVAGALAGLWHWAFYLVFRPQPAVTGSWEEAGIINRFPALGEWLLKLMRNAWQIFQNIFGFEFSYRINFYKEGNQESILVPLNRAAVYFSAAVLVLGCFLAGRRLIRLIRKKEPWREHSWITLFHLFLLTGFLARASLFRQPRLEPRHNFDLVLVIVMSYFLVASALLRNQTLRWLKISGLAVVLIALMAPHFCTYLRTATNKQDSYGELMSTLRECRVKALKTDFILAYTIYFLSNRNIAVSDTLGPLSLRLFYNEMSARVDALPPAKCAYVFFADNYPSRDWHKAATLQIKEEVRQELLGLNIPFRVVRLRDYVLFIPRPRNF